MVVDEKEDSGFSKKIGKSLVQKSRVQMNTNGKTEKSAEVDILESFYGNPFSFFRWRNIKTVREYLPESFANIKDALQLFEEHANYNL